MRFTISFCQRLYSQKHFSTSTMPFFFETNKATSPDVDFDLLIKSASKRGSLGVQPSHNLEGAVPEVIEDGNEADDPMMEEVKSSSCHVMEESNEVEDNVLDNSPGVIEADVVGHPALGSHAVEVDPLSVEPDVKVTSTIRAPSSGNLSDEFIEGVAIESAFSLSGWDWKFLKEFNGRDLTTVDHGIFEGLGFDDIDVEKSSEVVLYGFDGKIANCGRFRNQRRCHNWYGPCAEAGGNCPTRRHQDLYKDFIFTRTAVELAEKQHCMSGK